MDWSEIQRIDPIFLNLGGGRNCHPAPGYLNYISVDMNPPDSHWAVRHDLRNRIPLPDASVMRIHSEDFLEHITVEDMKALLVDCHRLLKPGGRMRIGVPDYNNPKDRAYLKKGTDPRLPDHATLTTYDLLRGTVEQSPFSSYKFYHYWAGNTFNQEPIDYSLGMIKRTPDNDPRSRRTGRFQEATGYLADFAYRLSRGFRTSDQDLLVRKGRRLYVTSLVVDLYKE